MNPYLSVDQIELLPGAERSWTADLMKFIGDELHNRFKQQNNDFIAKCSPNIRYVQFHY